LGQAQDANAGVILALDLLPDVMLLDIYMPGRDAFDACLEIVDRTACQVLFWTGDCREAYLDRAIAAGASGMASKETESTEALASAITRVAAGDT